MSLQKLKGLAVCQQRKAAAILGALVADAAIAPLHWIYDQGKVADLISKQGDFAFYPTSQCPYYTIPTGNNSTYGDQLYVTLKNIAENKGFNKEKLADALFQAFGPGTVYEAARLQSSQPVNGPWTNHCLKIMIAKRENGESPAVDSNSKDPDGFCKTVALAGLLKEGNNLSNEVKDCVETVQTNPVAVNFALRSFGILENVVRTGVLDLDAKCKDIQDTSGVEEAIAKAKNCSDPVVKAAKTWGLACGYPASFTVGAYGAKCAKGYVEAVKEQAESAGDTCSRVVFVAAVCGAQYGLDAIPEEWLKKYSRAEEVLGYIETVVQL